jgi:hypothetical protein
LNLKSSRGLAPRFRLQSLLKLPREDRRRFATWFHAHEAEILNPQEDDEIHPQVRAEVLRRSAELNADPSLALPVTDEWFKELKRKLVDARPLQAPVG